MNYIIDTHILLWWLNDASKLSSHVKDIISKSSNIIYVSSASLWEIRIKQSIGKIDLPNNFQNVLDSQGFKYLNIKPEHTHEIINLPMYHRDPFDRMIIAQARLEKFYIITNDKHFVDYKAKIVFNS